MSERLLLRNDRHMVVARIGHQGRRICRRNCPPRWRRQRIRRVTRGVLEVGRVDIDLVPCQRSNHLLFELERCHWPARKVVLQPTVAHSRPVANRRRMQHGGGCRVGLDQLLHRLQCIEDSFSRSRRDRQSFAVRDHRIAFSLHLLWKVGGRIRASGLHGIFIDGPRERRTIANHQQGDWRRGVDRHAPGCKKRSEVGDRELVFRSTGSGAVDLDSSGERLRTGSAYEARHRDQMQRRSL